MSDNECGQPGQIGQPGQTGTPSLTGPMNGYEGGRREAWHRRECRYAPARPAKLGATPQARVW